MREKPGAVVFLHRATLSYVFALPNFARSGRCHLNEHFSDLLILYSLPPISPDFPEDESHGAEAWNLPKFPATSRPALKAASATGGDLAPIFRSRRNSRPRSCRVRRRFRARSFELRYGRVFDPHAFSGR